MVTNGRRDHGTRVVPFVVYFVAVLLAAWAWGAGPGRFAVAASACRRPSDAPDGAGAAFVFTLPR